MNRAPVGGEHPGPPQAWTRAVGKLLAHGVWNARVLGAENVPTTGPVLFAANHASIVDGPLLYGVTPRRAHFLVKKEMFEGSLLTRFVGGALLQAGQIPIDRTRGDRDALQSVLAVLAAGGAAGVFPEGTRGRGDAASVRSGIAWIALQSGAPVVPVACLGAHLRGEPPRSLPPLRRKLTFCFGEPFTVVKEPGVPGRTALANAVERVRVELSSHVLDSLQRTGIQLPEDQDGADELGLGEMTSDDVPGGTR
ncbi:lysophospholipid acyltransferase family protein [Kineococcus radiotolerans]|uniref:Phospholipid/glycerol acyltransferase n=1 Tax=Kineococcus radiotolerans (strain ATCC BAA-149 / DSM 14245 / SRS30216) TaxID=266940 RepID=A6WCP1_KINRD|nr:lysophospholipid acyltransferase family protein [Kineococcus radiotolerans]ABS04580.1 phospholipid/glycerol acyltransferase [Kineococcus radiotolerans SRS30216 = ATCC BAA-149]